MKKVGKFLFVSLSLFGMVLTGCSSEGGTNIENQKQLEIYRLYYEDGGTLTYEEWLKSIQGADGSTTLVGTTNPEISEGKNGDVFINTTSWDLFVKNGGAWSKIGNIMGPQGSKGDDGVSILSVEKTNTEGLVDTYTISYSDGHTSTFTITNGMDGEQGIQGKPGENGHSPVVTISEDGYWIIDGVATSYVARGPQGPQGEQGSKGEDGNDGEDGVSILSIEKTGEDGLVDIYTIYYSDEHTSTFTVTNGAAGAQGIQGVKGEDGHTPVITISSDGYWVIDSVKTETKAEGTMGPQGPQGVSIVSITKTGSDGLVDIYTIRYSDGGYDTFTVTNGANGTNGTNGTDGAQGPQGIQGNPGEDGHTPVITISEDGYWVVDGETTSYVARGPQGPQGVSIVSVAKAYSEDLVDTYIITFSDAHTASFTVTNGANGTNGADGAQGEQGIQGVPGVDGHTPVITISEDGYWVVDGETTSYVARGPQGPRGEQGPQGVSIVSVAKASSDGLLDTYIITFSNGVTSTFNVTNGAQGIQGVQGNPGVDGHSPVVSISSDGYWTVDGEKTSTLAQGPKGLDGVSIVSIVKASSEGLVDTYIITYSDTTTSTFTVTNGQDGAQGIQGLPGADGHTPTIEMSEDGYWVIDGIKTDTPVRGPQGEPGADGTMVSTGSGVPSDETGQNGDSYIDLQTWNYYVKAGGVWILKGNIKGPTGEQGPVGKSAYESYIEYHPDYEGDEGQWVDDLVNGRLSSCEQITITFDSNGGPSVPSVVINKGDKVPKPTCSYTGFELDGWYYESEKWSFIGYTATEEMTLVARWNPISYTITYNSNGGLNPSDNPRSYTVLDSFTLLNAQKTNCDFEGWYTDSSFTNRIYSISKGSSGNLNLYAKFLPEMHTITYNTNGGNSIAKKSIRYGESIPSVTPTRKGYTFSGWYSDSGLTVPYAFPSTMPTSDIVVYAKWTQITYKAKVVGNAGGMYLYAAPEKSSTGQIMTNGASFNRKSGQSFYLYCSVGGSTVWKEIKPDLNATLVEIEFYSAEYSTYGARLREYNASNTLIKSYSYMLH